MPMSLDVALSFIFLKHMKESIKDDIIYVVSTGYLSRAVYRMHPKWKNVFYMQGSMGLAPAIGLGMALKTKKKVVVITGDAALLMHLGITHTIRDADLDNLFVYVIKNGCHESTGGQPCSEVKLHYPGVTEVLKVDPLIPPRIDMSFNKITENVKDSLNALKQKA